MLNNVISDPLLGRFTVRGWYSIGAVSGAVAGSVAANGQLFSMLWEDSTYSALVSRITVAAKCEAFSSGLGADFQAIIGRNATVAPSGGTAIVPGNATDCQALSSQDYSASLFNSEGDLRIASTGALTAGTLTLDTTGIGYAAVLTQLRTPRYEMPAYTAVQIPDSGVADIYAYLTTLPKPPDPKSLKQLQ